MKEIIFVGASDWKLPHLTKYFNQLRFKVELKTTADYVHAEGVETFFITSAQSLLPSFEIDFLEMHPGIKNLLLLNPDFDEYGDVLEDLQKRMQSFEFWVYDERALSPAAKDIFSIDQIDYIHKTLSFMAGHTELRNEIEARKAEKEKLDRQAVVFGKIGDLEPKIMGLRYGYGVEKSMLYDQLSNDLSRMNNNLKSFSITPYKIGPGIVDDLCTSLSKTTDNIKNHHNQTLFWMLSATISMLFSTFFIPYGHIVIGTLAAGYCIWEYNKTQILFKALLDLKLKKEQVLRNEIKKSDTVMDENLIMVNVLKDSNTSEKSIRDLNFFKNDQATTKLIIEIEKSFIQIKTEIDKAA